MPEANPKLILGTAKLGLPNYGIHGAKQLPASSEELLDCAFEKGITTLDTAPRYGNAETLIGQYHRARTHKFQITSKVEGLRGNDSESATLIDESVCSSLERIGVDVLDTLYLHQNELDIISDPYVQAGLARVKEKKLVRKVGVSIYSSEECSYAVNSGFYDVVQLPVSVLDSGFYNAFALESDTPVELVGRSIFLQGIVFNRDNVLEKIKDGEEVLSYLEELDGLCANFQLSPDDVAIPYVERCRKLSGYIVGASSVQQIVSAVKAAQKSIPEKLYEDIFDLSIRPRAWTNPRNW